MNSRQQEQSVIESRTFNLPVDNIDTDLIPFWHPRGFKVAEVVEEVSGKTGIPMAQLAIAWLLRRKYVSSVIIGVRTQDQLAANLEPGDWDMPEEAWKILEERTRPEEEYQTWFNKMAYARFFSAADLHDERAELI